jgi:hypothetical protein
MAGRGSLAATHGRSNLAATLGRSNRVETGSRRDARLHGATATAAAPT